MSRPKIEETVTITCPNCGGTGKDWDYIPQLHDTILDVCVRCNGLGKLEVPADRVQEHSQRRD